MGRPQQPPFSFLRPLGRVIYSIPEMPDLTPEDRQRIYEEEKFRLEAQQQLKAEQAGKSLGTGQKITLGCFILIIGFALLLAIGGMMGQHETERFEALTPDQKRAENIKSCVNLEQSWAFKTYSELSPDERKLKLSCDLLLERPQ